MYDIVIARYNESLNWLDWLTPEQKSRVKVYNKGPDDLSCPVTENLPNVGREGHTYLWYIIQNYDSLPEHVIFMQAHPFDHFKFEPKEIPDVLSEWIRETKWHGITKGRSGRDYATTQREFRVKDYKGMIYQSSFNFGEWMDEFVEKDVCPPKRVHGCGFFGVSRKLIKTRSVEYYKKILDDLAVDNNPESGHYLERSWHYIFNGHRHTPGITKILILLVGIIIFIGSQVIRVK
jgi:hypothetical protein